MSSSLALLGSPGNRTRNGSTDPQPPSANGTRTAVDSTLRSRALWWNADVQAVSPQSGAHLPADSCNAHGIDAGSFSAGLEALAIDAARGGAELIARRLDPTLIETKSSATDLVTDVDRAVEAHVVGLIRSRRPGDAILGEEGGVHPSVRAGAPAGRESEVRWVIDPIDGTVNFVLGLPIFAVSVAAEVAGITVAGCVVRVRVGDGDGDGEVFHARLGGGSFLGLGARALRLHGPRTVGLDQAVVGTGFSYDSAVRTRQGAVLAAILGRIANLRRLGSAALDLCYVADGRLDAYYEAGTKEWDRAAGILVAAEAGVSVGAVGGGSDRAALDQCLLAASAELFPELASLLGEVKADRVMDGSA